ncbi:hypothetical protein K488DRAFT_83940 [Vararia minispora EC-137]|uniref:Uncharacterized protein n=1 Tax=Vararia minispora EC-137 TaxID=1314806 RepID=A0ACB8QS64_9AGAM|nr:hypothetical protein K488DRAFT_83940 [Vararia minispora EC-137]
MERPSEEHAMLVVVAFLEQPGSDELRLCPRTVSGGIHIVEAGNQVSDSQLVHLCQVGWDAAQGVTLRHLFLTLIPLLFVGYVHAGVMEHQGRFFNPRLRGDFVPL